MEPSFITKSREKLNEANEALMATENCRMIVTSEPKKTDLLQSDLVKKYTGDPKVRTRANYGKSKEIDIGFKIFLLCNSIPNLDKCDKAEYERLAVIKFDSYFTDNPTKKNEFLIDRSLSEKLSHCRVEMFHLLLEYYELYKKEGLIMPERVIKNTNVYREKVKSSDDIYNYIRERLVHSEEDTRIKCSDIWKDYSDWCMENNKKKGRQYDLEEEICNYFDIEEKISIKTNYFFKNIMIKKD
jgi:phage/plasmid-associated DNA primase